MSKHLNLVPDRAASIVVHPTPGVGDCTTIAEAVALLASNPGASGQIYLREGTYSPSAETTLPAGKNITVFGTGDGTIINLAANAIGIFQIPTQSTVAYRFEFKSFSVTGTEVVNQRVVTYNDGKGLSELFFDNINTSGVEQFVRVTDGSFDGATPGQDNVKLHLNQCRIRPVSTDTGIMITNPSINFAYIQCWMTEVQLMGDSIFAIPSGGRTQPLFGLPVGNDYFGDLYVTNCAFSLGNTTGVALDHMEFGVCVGVNTEFINNDVLNTPYIQCTTEGSGDGVDGSNFHGCSFFQVKFQHFEPAVCYTACNLDACSFIPFSSAVFQGNFFTSTVSPYPDDGTGNPYIIENFGTGTAIIGNVWGGFDAVPTGVISGTQASMIEVFAETTISLNDFSDVHPPAVVGIIEIFNSNCVLVGNRFPFAPTSGPPMKDWNGANYYYANSQLFNQGNGAPIMPPTGDGFDPVKGAAGNTIEGMRSWTGTGSVGGTATNNVIVNYQNPNGLAQVQGYIKNTGANNITVDEVYTTIDEGTFTRTTVVAAGAQINLNPYDFTGLGGGIDFQVVNYTVKISGTTISWKIYFPTPGGVWKY